MSEAVLRCLSVFLVALQPVLKYWSKCTFWTRQLQTLMVIDLMVSKKWRIWQKMLRWSFLCGRDFLSLLLAEIKNVTWVKELRVNCWAKSLQSISFFAEGHRAFMNIMRMSHTCRTRTPVHTRTRTHARTHTHTRNSWRGQTDNRKNLVHEERSSHRASCPSFWSLMHFDTKRGWKG